MSVLLPKRKSTLFFLLAILLGVLPLSGGMYMQFLGTGATNSHSSEFDAEAIALAEEAVRAQIEREHHDKALEELLERSSSQQQVYSAMPPPEEIGTGEYDTPLPPSITAAASPVEPTVSNSQAVTAFGGGSALLFAILGFVWRNKENAELVQEILTGDNDLKLLTVRERFVMWLRSFSNQFVKVQYNLRRNRGWSVYSAPTLVLECDGTERYIFVLNRIQQPTDDILNQLSDLLPRSDDVDELKVCELREGHPEASTTITDWHISPAFDEFMLGLNDSYNDEHVVFISVRNGEGELRGHTLTSDCLCPPDDLISWELFIDSFRDKFYFNDDESILESVIVAYRLT